MVGVSCAAREPSGIANITASGDIVGSTGTATAQHATLWRANGTIVDLGALPGCDFSTARGINQSGVIVGVGCSTGPDQERALMWQQNGTLVDLGTLPGGTNAQASGINKHGVIVGRSGTATPPLKHAVRWR